MVEIMLLLLSAQPPTEKKVERSNNHFYAHRRMVSPHLSGIRSAGWLMIPPFTSTGAVHKSVTFSYVFMLVQLNKCVVVSGSDLQRGHSGAGCLSSSIFSVVRDICLLWVGLGYEGLLWGVLFRCDVRWVLWCLWLYCVVGCAGMRWLCWCECVCLNFWRRIIFFLSMSVV